MIKFLILMALPMLAACNDGGGVMREIERAEQEEAQVAEQGEVSSADFLAAAAARPGATSTPSGLVYEVRTRSPDQALPRPTAEAVALVHYEGKLADGTVFDSSFERGEPAQFPLAQVVPGFTETIMLMRPGDEFLATFPAALGYGPEGRPPVIPPNSALQFRIQLLAFQEPNGSIVQAPR